MFQQVVGCSADFIGELLLDRRPCPGRPHQSQLRNRNGPRRGDGSSSWKHGHRRLDRRRRQHFVRRRQVEALSRTPQRWPPVRRRDQPDVQDRAGSKIRSPVQHGRGPERTSGCEVRGGFVRRRHAGSLRSTRPVTVLGNMGWEARFWIFTAVETRPPRITFLSPKAECSTPAVDNVRITAVEIGVQAHPDVMGEPGRRPPQAIAGLLSRVRISSAVRVTFVGSAARRRRGSAAIPSGVQFTSRSRPYAPRAPNRPASATPDRRATASVARPLCV